MAGRSSVKAGAVFTAATISLGAGLASCAAAALMMSHPRLWPVSHAGDYLLIAAGCVLVACGVLTRGRLRERATMPPLPGPVTDYRTEGPEEARCIALEHRPCETAPNGTGVLCLCGFDCANYWLRANGYKS